MDLHLSRTPKSRRKAYDRAIFFKPTIANDKDLKLLFLRACMYDGEKAAARILKHFKGTFWFGLVCAFVFVLCPNECSV